MGNIKNFDKIVLSILICLIFISYLTGFIVTENSAGGAIFDVEFVKRNILAFKNNTFLEAIKLTATQDREIYMSTRSPGFYVFNKYLNPFVSNLLFFQGYITVFSLLIPVLLFLNLKIKFKDTNIYFLILISSLILLSPYLRTSAFWGLEENFGIVMVGFSALFLQLYNDHRFKKYSIVFLICLALFSSLCVYSDQKLIIIPFLSLIFVLIAEKKNYEKILLISLYVIFSIPFIYLIKLWGNIAPTGDAVIRQIDVLSINLNYHHIGFSISIIAFYLFPFFFLLEDKKENLRNFFKNKTNYLLIIIFIFYLAYFLSYYNLENMYYLGGGVFQKLVGILFSSLLLQKIALSFIFIFSWILILIFTQRNFLNFLVLTILPLLSIYISPAIFQEYFDPLIFFLILVYLKKEFSFSAGRCIFLFSYFTLFLLSAIFYYS